MVRQGRRRNKSQGGRGSGNKTNNKNKSNEKSGENLMFMTGDNQAERYQKIIRQMSQEAQSKYGKDMAYILENETEVEIPPPALGELFEKQMKWLMGIE